MADAADHPFRREDLDQRLLFPKLQDLAEEMQRRVAEGERKAAFDTRKSGNSAGYLSRLFDLHLELTDEWAKRVYETHCEVWRIQGHSISPDFIRAVSRAIPELIATRKGAVAFGARLWCTRTRQSPNAVALGKWSRAMDSLVARWARKLEAAAVASEYRAPRLIRRPTAEQASETGELSLAVCAVCGHYEAYHDQAGCFLDPRGRSSQDPGILARPALKKTGALCWCPKFLTDFSQAADLIYESGNSRALERGTDEAIRRGDSKNASRLLDQLIIKTHPEARDLDWIRAMERSIARLRADATPGRIIERTPRLDAVARLPNQQTIGRALLQQEIAEGGVMIYPLGFPPESRARVEAEKIKAGRDFDSAKQLAEWKRDIEIQLRHYILRTFLVFAKEACVLRLWSVDKMDSECREFLRLLTLDAYHQKGYDKGGGRLSEMISHWSGAVLSDVQREFETAREWTQYQDVLLEVAEAQISKEGRSSSPTQSGSPSFDGASKTGATVVGRNIDRFRKDCGWSFNDLSEQTGLDKKLILGHVNEGKGIRPSSLKLYADAFARELGRTVTVTELETP